MTYSQKLRALKATKLSSFEYSQVKELKAFNAADWKWNSDELLYERAN